MSKFLDNLALFIVLVFIAVPLMVIVWFNCKFWPEALKLDAAFLFFPCLGWAIHRIDQTPENGEK